MKQVKRCMNTIKEGVEYATNNYDLLYPDHIRQYRSTIKNLKTHIVEEPKTILAIACGTGIDLTALKPLGWKSDLYGFDLLPEFIEETRVNLAKEDMKAKLWVGDLFHENFDCRQDLEGSFDLIVFRGNSLGHFSTSQYVEIFKNLYTVVKPGGKIIFDYRDGEKYFADKNGIEYLGESNYGNNEHSYAFYEKYWPTIDTDPYEVVGRIKITNQNAEEYYLSNTHLIGHFGNPEFIQSRLTSVGFKNCTEVSESFGESLKYLRTFIATK